MSMSPYQPNTDVYQYTELPGTPDLMNWAAEATEVYKVAEALARTQFVPPALRGKPDDICAQIMYGRDVKLPPMVALQQIHIIEGRPSLSALSMRGMAQSSGVKFRLEESTETRCRMSAIAPGDAAPTTITWTTDRAKKLGLTTKSNWIKQPQAMLIARATSELCRLVAAPLFLGMAYSTEELRDGGAEFDMPEQPQPAADAPAERTIRRKPLKAEATVEQQPNTAPQPEPGQPAGVSDNVRKALMASFNEADIKDRTMRLSYVSDILKREVGSVNEITDDEGKRVLDALRRDAVLNHHDADLVDWPDSVEVPA